jgi:2-oxoglutarate ferredoxin oxidoreductase subunit alpha
MHAFNLAEEYRCPVFIASNKEIATTRENIDIDTMKKPDIRERKMSSSGNPFLPFSIHSSEHMVPDFMPIGGKTLVRQTSSTHGPDGYITTDPREIAETRRRLKNKLISNVDNFCLYEEYCEDDADTLLLTYGVTSRAAKEVYKEQKRRGKPVSLLIIKSLWPVPENLIREKTKNANRVIVVEMNLGQYLREIERILPEKKVQFLGQMDGMLITPEQIGEVINNA